MAYILNATKVPFGAVAALRLVNAFSNTADWLRERRDARRTLLALDRLTDHQLKDIGLRRIDYY
ncbi:DUF1127 domain-containing protein [Shimia biformata]|uniref:DUF1127 domain-containing protein n=1 Tax=Shimia biformata TaxID=1294299 RepID=UPI0019508171|nr:DUF1127 domain-containing protein [Shimia biformata]